MRTVEIRENGKVVDKWIAPDYPAWELSQAINKMFRELKADARQAMQQLPEQFQGLHLRDNCPNFKGGGCPNCRSREAGVEQ